MRIRELAGTPNDPCNEGTLKLDDIFVKVLIEGWQPPSLLNSWVSPRLEMCVPSKMIDFDKMDGANHQLVQNSMSLNYAIFSEKSTL